MELSKTIEINNLIDIYGKFLTEKQLNIMIDYFKNDYSLSEIAENMAISRNAVWDSLQKACNALEEYESKLNLHKNAKLLDKYLVDLEPLTNESGKAIINKIKEME